MPRSRSPSCACVGSPLSVGIYHHPKLVDGMSSPVELPLLRGLRAINLDAHHLLPAKIVPRAIRKRMLQHKGESAA